MKFIYEFHDIYDFVKVAEVYYSHTGMKDQCSNSVVLPLFWLMQRTINLLSPGCELNMHYFIAIIYQT